MGKIIKDTVYLAKAASAIASVSLFKKWPVLIFTPHSFIIKLFMIRLSTLWLKTWALGEAKFEADMIGYDSQESKEG